jgi:hypothetical protein
MKNETIKTEWSLRSCFEQMRDANGGVMLTEKQQEEIIRLVEERKKKWIKCKIFISFKLCQKCLITSIGHFVYANHIPTT